MSNLTVRRGIFWKFHLLIVALIAIAVFASIYKNKKKLVDKAEYRLIWSDEFDRDGELNTNWAIEERFVRNEECQYYTPKNVSIKDGCLVIEARNEEVENSEYDPSSDSWRYLRKSANYTSASVKTLDWYLEKGRSLEIKAKIPYSQTVTPVIWFLGMNGTWPDNGRIELLNGKSVANELGLQHKAAFNDFGRSWFDDFHVWRLDWIEESHIQMYVDDVLYNSIRLGDEISVSPVDNKFFLLISMVVDDVCSRKVFDAEFPYQYHVDYVRVFDSNNHKF